MAKKSKAKKKPGKKKKAAPASKKKKTMKSAKEDGTKKARRRHGEEGGAQAQSAGEEAALLDAALRQSPRPLHPGRRPWLTWQRRPQPAVSRSPDSRLDSGSAAAPQAAAFAPRRIDQRIASLPRNLQ